MILRSDDTVASGGTLSTFLSMGFACKAVGVESVDFLPLMGAGKDLARAEVLAAFYHHSKADDLLWVDFGNAIPDQYLVNYVELLLSSEKEALWCPYITRAEGRKLSFACSLPGDLAPGAYVEHERIKTQFGAEDESISHIDIRLMRLGGCGFGMTRIRRDLVRKLYEHYRRERRFLSDRTTFGELECIDVFASRLARRVHDRERPDRPIRLLPEDDSFWHYCREIGISPYAIVDYPCAHGSKLPGVGYPSFEEWIVKDAASRMPPASRLIVPEA